MITFSQIGLKMTQSLITGHIVYLVTHFAWLVKLSALDVTFGIIAMFLIVTHTLFVMDAEATSIRIYIVIDHIFVVHLKIAIALRCVIT